MIRRDRSHRSRALPARGQKHTLRSSRVPALDRRPGALQRTARSRDTSLAITVRAFIRAAFSRSRTQTQFAREDIRRTVVRQSSIPRAIPRAYTCSTQAFTRRHRRRARQSARAFRADVDKPRECLRARKHASEAPRRSRMTSPRAVVVPRRDMDAREVCKGRVRRRRSDDRARRRRRASARGEGSSARGTDRGRPTTTRARAREGATRSISRARTRAWTFR